MSCLRCYAPIHASSFDVLQSWRIPYYFSGAFGLIVALLCALSVPEPTRKTIGEEKVENEEEGNKVSGDLSPAKMRPQLEEKKHSPWKVMLQPRILMLCLAASVRHTGRCDLDYHFESLMALSI